MAHMTDEERADVTAEYNRVISDARIPCGVTKADLRAAINAIDGWISDNAASLNAAIPQPARAALTSAEKTRLFKMVLTKRYMVGA